MPEFNLRTLRTDEWPIVAAMICESIRQWFSRVGSPGRFPGGPPSCMVFPEVYEDLDPNCCLVAEDVSTGRLAASCFYHPRPHHISIGIMAVHPDYFGRGAARLLLAEICRMADERSKPLRLFSSAMNIDSFSLYTRAGFVPRDVYQIMTISVPSTGMTCNSPGLEQVREARESDVSAMVALEWEVSGISRETDYRRFITNRMGIWKTQVMEDSAGVSGFLVSIDHPGSRMVGPGVMRDASSAAALILSQLDRFRGRTPLCLVPASCTTLVSQLYRWGLRNTELSLFQSRGPAQPFRGVMMPTFMPETG